MRVSCRTLGNKREKHWFPCFFFFFPFGLSIRYFESSVSEGKSVWTGARYLDEDVNYYRGEIVPDPCGEYTMLSTKMIPRIRNEKRGRGRWLLSTLDLEVFLVFPLEKFIYFAMHSYNYYSYLLQCLERKYLIIRTPIKSSIRPDWSKYTSINVQITIV